jgi:hypothetical protein
LNAAKREIIFKNYLKFIKTKMATKGFGKWDNIGNNLP